MHLRQDSDRPRLGDLDVEIVDDPLGYAKTDIELDVIEGETAVLLGASGAGKSTLVNALLGEERQATGEIREDGRGMFTSYLFQVKSPAESKGPWDYFKQIAHTSGEEAYRPLADGHCPLVKA